MTRKHKIIYWFSYSNIQAVTQMSDTTPVQMITEQQLELNQQLSLDINNYLWAGLFTNIKHLPFRQYMRPLASSRTRFAPLCRFTVFPIHESISLVLYVAKPSVMK